MDKILVNVFVPALNTSYDMFIKKNLKIYELSMLISKAVMELSDEYYISSNDELLCDRESGNIFNINVSVKELDLKNGSRLMLI